MAKKLKESDVLQKTVDEWFDYLDDLFNFKQILKDYGYDVKKVQKALNKEFMYGESNFDFFVTKLGRYLDDDILVNEIFNKGNKADIKSLKRMQTGLGMAQVLPTNVMYRGGITDLYNERRNKTMERLTEKKIDDEDRKKALADFLEIEDIDEIENGYRDECFEVNGEEWMVLTEDESYDEFKEYEMSLIDDLGLEAFSENFQEHILENCINEDFFDTVAEEEASYYIDEMPNEELLDYAHDHNMWEEIEDIEDETFEKKVDRIRDDCREEYAQNILDQGMSEYFEQIYGCGWVKEMKDTLEKEIDWKQVIDDLYDWDSRETLWGGMASYDGIVHELDKVNGEWLFAYQTN